MQLSQELPDYTYALRGADGASARVNERVLVRSFIIAPEALIEDWPVASATLLEPAHWQPVLDLAPELVLLGTGDRQVFPPAAALAACLSRGIGVEVMSNDAAARTYSVLASEGRRVAVALILRG